MLEGELRLTPEKSLQGGPRAARRATTLLVTLGRTTQACQLFLGHRTAILRASLKRLRLEGKAVLYVRQLSNVFFHALRDTAMQFQRAFPVGTSQGCASALVVWAHTEISHFGAIFAKQVFTPQVGPRLE